MSHRPKKVHVGDAPIIYVDCLDANGVAATPTDGRLLYSMRGASVSTEVSWASLIKEPDLGDGPIVGRVEWVADVLDTAGIWDFWWEFTETVIAAEPYSLNVLPRTVPDPAP